MGFPHNRVCDEPRQVCEEVRWQMLRPELFVARIVQVSRSVPRIA